MRTLVVGSWRLKERESGGTAEGEGEGTCCAALCGTVASEVVRHVVKTEGATPWKVYCSGPEVTAALAALETGKGVRTVAEAETEDTRRALDDDDEDDEVFQRPTGEIESSCSLS